MKYKIIPDDIVKNLIEFLDEIQFEAASSNNKEDLHRINFINWMISELMNGLDGFDLPEDNDKDADIDIDIQGRWDTIDNYKKDFGMEFPEDMSEEELKIDHELTNKEKFELYYSEYRRRKREDNSKSLRQLLRSAGIKKPPKK
jgi:hypothetical protein